jgi:hypothetical protein
MKKKLSFRSFELIFYIVVSSGVYYVAGLLKVN